MMPSSNFPNERQMHPTSTEKLYRPSCLVAGGCRPLTALRAVRPIQLIAMLTMAQPLRLVQGRVGAPEDHPLLAPGLAHLPSLVQRHRQSYVPSLSHAVSHPQSAYHSSIWTPEKPCSVKYVTARHMSRPFTSFVSMHPLRY